MEKNILNKKTCGWKNLSSKEKDEIFNPYIEKVLGFYDK